MSAGDHPEEEEEESTPQARLLEAGTQDTSSARSATSATALLPLGTLLLPQMH